MARSRVEIHTSQFRAYLRQSGMVDGIDGVTTAIAAAAGPGFEHDAHQGYNRAYGGVIAATVDAVIAERRDRALTRAIDAGRAAV